MHDELTRGSGALSVCQSTQRVALRSVRAEYTRLGRKKGLLIYLPTYMLHISIAFFSPQHRVTGAKRIKVGLIWRYSLLVSC